MVMKTINDNNDKHKINKKTPFSMNDGDATADTTTNNDTAADNNNTMADNNNNNKQTINQRIKS